MWLFEYAGSYKYTGSCEFYEAPTLWHYAGTYIYKIFLYVQSALQEGEQRFGTDMYCSDSSIFLDGHSDPVPTKYNETTSARIWDIPMTLLT